MVTWNPADKHAEVTLSGSDLTASCASSTDWRTVRATTGKSSGKFYYEAQLSAAWALVGIASSAQDLALMMGVIASSGGVDHLGECIINNGLAYDGADLPAGGVIGCAVNADAGTMAIYVNNTLFYTMTGFPAGTTYYPALSLSRGGTVTAHFSAASFTYTPPTGFESLEASEPGKLVQYKDGQMATSKVTVDAFGSVTIPAGQNIKIGDVTLPVVAGFALSLFTTSSSTTTDGQTVYFGFGALAVTTTAASRRVYAPRACTIKAVTAVMNASTAGTAESFSIYVRVNNTTDYLIATVAVSNTWRIFANAALSIALAAGDYFEIKVVYPTWATNPATVTWNATIFCE